MSKNLLVEFCRKTYARRPFDEILFRFSNGRTASDFIFKIVPSHTLFAANSWRNVKRDGCLFHLDISHIVDWFIFFGVKEIARDALYGFIKEGTVLYDIGGNIGDVTVHAALKTGTKGKVYSFEPHPQTYRRLSEHIQLNKLTNVVAFNVGLGSSAGSFVMEEVENNAGANRIVSPGTVDAGRVTVQVVTLDAQVDEHQMLKPDVIKIDVEGFEMQVLIGAKAIIEKCRPTLFIELSDALLKLQNETATGLVKLISSYGYKIENANDHTQVDEHSDLTNCHFDIIAIPNPS
jgi:FkbM family methyltransferase